MDLYAKLLAGYWLDPVVAALPDDEAEVLFVRSISYCAAAGTAGFVAVEIVPGLMRRPARAPRAIAALLQTHIPDHAPLWHQVAGGYLIASWSRHQDALDHIHERRRGDAERQARRRRRLADEAAAAGDLFGALAPDSTPDIQATPSRDTSRDITPANKTKTKSAAAAAGRARARGGSGGVALADPTIAQLRGHLDAEGLTVRWDTLTGNDLTEVRQLIEVHGEDALVRAALAARSAHTVGPAYAAAWLPSWRTLPPPGQRLAVVPQARCPLHDTEPARSCRSCAGDRKAGGQEPDHAQQHAPDPRFDPDQRAVGDHRDGRP